MSHRERKKHSRETDGRGGVPSLETAHYRASAIVVDALDSCTRLLQREGRQATVRDSYHDMAAVGLLRSAFEPSSPSLARNRDSLQIRTVDFKFYINLSYNVR